MSSKYQEILAARELLGLPERASMEKIKSNYRQLISQWHPDKCNAGDEKCGEMTTRIIAAYNIILNYCSQYQYSFSEEEVRKSEPDEDWWFERFGDRH